MFRCPPGYVVPRPRGRWGCREPERALKCQNWDFLGERLEQELLKAEDTAHCLGVTEWKKQGFIGERNCSGKCLCRLLLTAAPPALGLFGVSGGVLVSPVPPCPCSLCGITPAEGWVSVCPTGHLLPRQSRSSLGAAPGPAQVPLIKGH